MRTVPMDTALGNMSDNDLTASRYLQPLLLHRTEPWELVVEYKSNVCIMSKHTSLYRLARIRSIK
jgi:hypothetical protein